MKLVEFLKFSRGDQRLLYQLKIPRKKLKMLSRPFFPHQVTPGAFFPRFKVTPPGGSRYLTDTKMPTSFLYFVIQCLNGPRSADAPPVIIMKKKMAGASWLYYNIYAGCH